MLGTGRLFVRNLAFVTTEADLRSHFSTFGPLEEVHLPVSNQTGSPLGTAFILFRDPSDALGAYKTLDKTTFQGRLLHVLPGRAKPGQEVNMDGVLDGKVLGKVNTGKGEVKKGIEAKRKEESARGVNWATLYMNVSPPTSALIIIRWVVGSVGTDQFSRAMQWRRLWPRVWASRNRNC